MNPTKTVQEPAALDAMLEAALLRLRDRGPCWQEAEAQLWGELFLAVVALVYPARAPRKSRAKADKKPPAML